MNLQYILPRILTYILTIGLFGLSIYKHVDNNIVHQVEVIHPAISKTEAVKCSLIEIRNKDKQTLEFYMDVESVICKKELCEIVPVRILWNPMGYFDRFELPKGVTLEKGYAEPFEEADYEKLQEILLDQQSELKDMDIDQLVNYLPGDDGVDGYSGATVLVSDDASISGAVLTCYTLWHWANGGVSEVVREITEGDFPLATLRDYLNHGNKQHNIFALEQLTRRKAFDQESISSVVEFTSSADRSYSTLALAYFEASSAPLYHSALDEVFQNGSPEHRNMVLSSLSKTEHKAPSEFYNQFSKQINISKSYSEINKILDLIQKKSPITEEITTQVSKLLDARDFITVRRAYWFLSNCKLSPAQKNTMTALNRKYADKL